MQLKALSEIVRRALDVRVDLPETLADFRDAHRRLRELISDVKAKEEKIKSNAAEGGAVSSPNKEHKIFRALLRRARPLIRRKGKILHDLHVRTLCMYVCS